MSDEEQPQPNPASNSDPEEQTSPEPGSSLAAAVFNFTNCIIGAGAIGLGGAFAASGGFISISLLLKFAYMTKLSLDMVIELGDSYEEIGARAMGRRGQLLVVASKFLYAFGCLVAYVVVVQDNFVSALAGLYFQHDTGDSSDWLDHTDAITWGLSAGVILPLCLLRDMTPLSNLSLLSVCSMICIVCIVMWIFAANPEGIRDHSNGGNFHDHWLAIRPGVWESLGTFVFSFVSQHTVHLAYNSIKPCKRTYANWTKVSFYSLVISTVVSLTVGLMVYMTFWENTASDLFELYPADWASIQWAKLLLCITMLLTFPLPFFTCREMVIVLIRSVMMVQTASVDEGQDEASVGLAEPLLSEHATPDTNEVPVTRPPSRVFLSSRQLLLSYHVCLSFVLWLVATALAIAAPSLGAVLNLVGCATGTVLAFILPSLFSYKLKGYSHQGLMIGIVGGLVGVVGTGFSIRNLLFP